MENLLLGRNAIGNKRVFKVKANPYGSIDRLKARLVAHFMGSVNEHEDYSETFFAVVKLSTLRAILAIAAKRNMHKHSANIETAFVNADLVSPCTHGMA
jgi:hypothetical protein